MSTTSITHKAHELLLLLFRYSIILTVLFFLPIPLSHFLTGSILSQTSESPIFQYFTHYNISTDQILQSVYTNVYIGESEEGVRQWDVDNAVLWGDALAYGLQEENVPVVKVTISDEEKVIQQQQNNKKSSKSKKSPSRSKANNKNTQTQTIITNSNNNNQPLIKLPQQLTQTIINIQSQLQQLLPFLSITESARQWIINGVKSNNKQIIHYIKQFTQQYPDDNFLVITKTPLKKLQSTITKIKLPSFNQLQAINVLVQHIKLTPKQALILLSNKNNSLLQILNNNQQQQQLTIKSLLGQSYIQLTENKQQLLSTKQQDILQKLCKQGRVKVGKKIVQGLQEFGVIIKNKYYQWDNDNSQLNYQLQQQIQCGKVSQLLKQQQQQDNQTKKNKSSSPASISDQNTITITQQQQQTTTINQTQL